MRGGEVMDVKHCVQEINTYNGPKEALAGMGCAFFQHSKDNDIMCWELRLFSL